MIDEAQTKGERTEPINGVGHQGGAREDGVLQKNIVKSLAVARDTITGRGTGSSQPYRDVLTAELEAIKQERHEQAPHRKGSDKIAGLALSGGGIRAGAFSLGVMQGLNTRENRRSETERNLFKEIDYLSTVSGGGYAGASVTWFRHIANSKPKPEDVIEIARTFSHAAKPSIAAMRTAYRYTHSYKAHWRTFQI